MDPLFHNNHLLLSFSLTYTNKLNLLFSFTFVTNLLSNTALLLGRFPSFVTSVMKHSLTGSFIVLATAAIVDYVNGEPIPSPGYYQSTLNGSLRYATRLYPRQEAVHMMVVTIPETDTVSSQVYPGSDYKEYRTVFETVYEIAYNLYPYGTVCHPETAHSTAYPGSSDIIYHTDSRQAESLKQSQEVQFNTQIMDETVTNIHLVTTTADTGGL